MRWREYVWYRELAQLLRLSLVALPLSFVLNRAAYRFVNPAFIGWWDYYTWPELCLSSGVVVFAAICFWRLLRVVISIAARTKGQLSNPQSSGRVRFWLLDIGRLFLQCIAVCMATAVPLLLAWAGENRHYFHTGPYPSTPILISWIAGGVTWWLLDRRIAPRVFRGVAKSPQCVIPPVRVDGYADMDTKKGLPPLTGVGFERRAVPGTLRFSRGPAQERV